MTKRIFVLIVLIIALPAYAWSAHNDDCSDSWLGGLYGNAGAKLWEEGKLERAEKNTRRAIKLEPDSSLWHQNLGFILDSMHRYDEAHESFKKSLEADSNWCTAYRTGSLMMTGDYFYRNKKYKKSIEQLEKAIVWAEKEKVDRRSLSHIYVTLSYNYTDTKEDGNPYYDLKAAERYKKKALELDPDDLFLQASYAKLLVLQGKMDEAEKSIAEILKAQEKRERPRSSVYSYFAHIYSILEDPAKAALYMQREMDLYPKHAAEYLLDELDRDFKQVAESKEMQPVIKRAREILVKE